MPSGFFERERSSVRTVRSKSVEAVHHGEHPLADGDFLPFQTIRITASIPGLVIGTHDWNDRVGETYTLENVRSDNRMDLHLREFFLRQFAWLIKDVFGNRELANVVQQGSGKQGPHLQIIQTERLAHPRHIDADAQKVIMGALIFSLDRPSPDPR